MALSTNQHNVAIKFVSQHDESPWSLKRYLQNGAQTAIGHIVVLPQSGASGGWITDATASTPGLICVGLIDEYDPNAGNAAPTGGSVLAQVSQRWVSGLPASTAAGDGFTDADFGKVFWLADNNTPGKLSNVSGNDRSMGGMVWGIDPDNGTPYLAVGAEHQALARAIHMCDTMDFGIALAADGAANSATAEIQIPRSATRGSVVLIEYIPSASVTANDTNYATITIARRRAGTSATILAATTQTTAQTAGVGNITAWVPIALNSTANPLANTLLRDAGFATAGGDILTLAITKGGAGVQLPAGVLRVTMQVL